MLFKFIMIWIIAFIALLILVPIILYIITFFYHLLKDEGQKKRIKGTRNFHIDDLKIPAIRRRVR